MWITSYFEKCYPNRWHFLFFIVSVRWHYVKYEINYIKYKIILVSLPNNNSKPIKTWKIVSHPK